jgi:hypothetical protein
MISDEDRKAAEEWVKNNFGWYDGYEGWIAGFLAGVEHERKRQEQKQLDGWPYAQAYKEQVELNFQRQINKFAEMFKKLTPIEQVGEKHWRIRDGHE